MRSGIWTSPPAEKIALLGLAIFVFGTAGCDQLFQNRSKRSLGRADQRRDEGNYPQAIALYEEALDGTARTAEIHYTLGLLHDDKLKAPVSAIHHFQRYLEIAPKGRHAKEARDLIKQSESKLGASLASGPLMTQQESARIKNENLKLQKLLVEERAKVAEMKVQLRAAQQDTRTTASTARKPPPGSKTYVVQQGDTLASIARKFYKSSERWKDIQDANFNGLQGTAKLKPGQTLIIP